MDTIETTGERHWLNGLEIHRGYYVLTHGVDCHVVVENDYGELLELRIIDPLKYLPGYKYSVIKGCGMLEINGNLFCLSPRFTEIISKEHYGPQVEDSNFVLFGPWEVWIGFVVY